MYVVPEEITGLPGFSYAEGMRCGVIFIGLDHYKYYELGMRKDLILFHMMDQ